MQGWGEGSGQALVVQVQAPCPTPYLVPVFDGVKAREHLETRPWRTPDRCEGEGQGEGECGGEGPEYTLLAHRIDHIFKHMRSAHLERKLPLAIRSDGLGVDHHGLGTGK
jgi:hypothetical protein